MSHHWSTFLSFSNCSKKDFHLPLQTNRVLQNLVVYFIFPFLYLEHLSKILLVLGNCLKKTSSQVRQLLVCCHDQCALLYFTFVACGIIHPKKILINCFDSKSMPKNYDLSNKIHCVWFKCFPSLVLVQWIVYDRIHIPLHLLVPKISNTQENLGEMLKIQKRKNEMNH